METLPIFLDGLVTAWGAILISVTLILLFGELLDFLLGHGRVALFRRAELKTLVDFHGNEAGKGGELTHDEMTIIAGALELSEKMVKDAMTPISDVSIFKSLAFIRFEGEGVQEKALELDGTDVEIKFPSYPIIQTSVVFVTGYDTGLAEIYIKIALRNRFSLCGEVTDVGLVPGCLAVITIGGKRCVEKALELSGRKMGEVNLVVDYGAQQTKILKSRRLIESNACGYMPGSYSCKLVKKRRWRWRRRKRRRR